MRRISSPMATFIGAQSPFATLGLLSHIQPHHFLSPKAADVSKDLSPSSFNPPGASFFACVGPPDNTHNHSRNTRFLNTRQMNCKTNGNGGESITARSNNNDLLQKHLHRLQSSPHQTLLLDGGTGEELFRYNRVPDDRKLWSATAIVNSQYHSTLEEVHRSFLRAGSHAITTNSYAIVPGVGFVDGEERRRLMDLAGKIARQAVSTRQEGTSFKGEGADALVLGSLGPLVESYRPDLIMKHDEGVTAYRFGIEGIYPHIDIFLAETMSCSEEARQVIDSLSLFYDGSIAKKPLLVSFTLGADGKVRSGESVVDVIPELIQYSFAKKVELIGVLFNCCEPESITKALNEIKSNPGIHHHLCHPPPTSSISTETTSQKPANENATLQSTTSDASTPPKILLGAYANRLTPVDPEWTLAASEEPQAMRDDLSPVGYWTDFVEKWHGDEVRDVDGAVGSVLSDDFIGGVQLIGGCCGIGPEFISCLREHLEGKV